MNARWFVDMVDCGGGHRLWLWWWIVVVGLVFGGGKYGFGPGAIKVRDLLTLRGARK
jgi:hypothetical protein